MLIMQVINSRKIQGKIFAESREKHSTNVLGFFSPCFGVAAIRRQPGTTAQLTPGNSLAMVFHCLPRRQERIGMSNLLFNPK